MRGHLRERHRAAQGPEVHGLGGWVNSPWPRSAHGTKWADLRGLMEDAWPCRRRPRRRQPSAKSGVAAGRHGHSRTVSGHTGTLVRAEDKTRSRAPVFRDRRHCGEVVQRDRGCSESPLAVEAAEVAREVAGRRTSVEADADAPRSRSREGHVASAMSRLRALPRHAGGARRSLRAVASETPGTA